MRASTEGQMLCKTEKESARETKRMKSDLSLALVNIQTVNRTHLW